MTMTPAPPCLENRKAVPRGLGRRENEHSGLGRGLTLNVRGEQGTSVLILAGRAVCQEDRA